MAQATSQPNIAERLSTQAGSFVSPALRQITLEVLKVNGVNLGQGVCQLPVPPAVLDFANEALHKGINRYADPRGMRSLREAIAKKLSHFNHIDADPETEVLVAPGATGAFEAICAALLDPGNEVILFEPYYPYHLQALKRYRANVKFVTLHAPDWEIDYDELKAAFTDKTKFLLINTPLNPTGKVFTQEELKAIAEIVRETNAFVVTDEIYEYMMFDGRTHLSPKSVEEFGDRVIMIGGYSKTFSITGWRIGYISPPKELSKTLTQIMDSIYVCAPAPLQEAVAKGIEHFGDQFYKDLNAKYEHKRDFFAKGLEEIGLQPLLPQGAYYMLASYGAVAPELNSRNFVSKMIAETGVGAVPSDDFVRDPSDAKWVRFCCAVEDEVLEDALQRMQSLKTK